MCCSHLQVKVEVPDFLALGEKPGRDSQQNPGQNEARNVCAQVCVCAHLQPGNREGGVCELQCEHMAKGRESFSDPMISRASEDFNVFHSTIKLPVPAGVSSQAVCLGA